MKAPFVWFGGKRTVANEVWASLGDVQSYVEPFAGSLAILLERPETHTGTTETVNDLDMYIANFWRALSCDPEQVAYYAEWPVNECDLSARHLWLVNEGQRQMANNLLIDPAWYDAKIAGWWVWGINSWIGSGWCSGKGPWRVVDGQFVKNKGDAGRGINRQRPHFGDAGQGINRQNQPLFDYMFLLAERLRRVRVACGDWSRVVTDGALSYGAMVGIFLDPPYSTEAHRHLDLYSVDSGTVAHDVRRWAIANGDNPRYRIVLAGYLEEHAMPDSWRVMQWKAAGGYGNNSMTGNANKHRECLWFSPNCLDPHVQKGLFDMQSAGQKNYEK